MTQALVVNELDNVATALETLEAGQRVTIGNTTIVVRERVARGHKLAVRRLAAGEAIVKFGNPIGTASSDIAEGAHVHTHNVASRRGRGDLAAREDVR